VVIILAGCLALEGGAEELVKREILRRPDADIYTSKSKKASADGLLEGIIVISIMASCNQ
jgi:hypothetical protein